MKNFIQNALGAKKLSLFVLGLLMSIAGIQRANAASEIYAALSGSTMTLYFDDQQASRPGVLADWSPVGGTYAMPKETCETITKAVIDPSMVDARPASTRSWFCNLANLTTIDGLANLNTSEVTDMAFMFDGCSSLTSLDVTGFNTAKVQNMNYMFAHCYALTSLDVSNFNTDKVSKMEGMFYGCKSLTSLDVSNFNIANVTTMYGMFYGCSSLTTINCEDDWSTGSAKSGYMFYGCTSLEGGNGTKYDADKIDKTYARPDGMGGKPGYFTAKGTVKNEIYATLSGSTMTIYFDNKKTSRSGVLDKWSLADGTYYLPEETRNSITKVAINPSMEDARPTGTYSWFENLKNLTTIEGLANLNTSEVTDMHSMFSGCTSLTSLDVSNFNTAKVQNMNYMFAHCYALTSLDVSNFNTDKVSKMEGMFYGCKSLTSLDVSNFNIANVTTMYGMFYGCSSLTTINCEDDWSTGSATSDNMFYGCTSLEGGNGTAYNSGKTDKTYARLDGLDGKPGYFSAKGVVRKTIYATLSGSTMTLYYDDQKASRSGVLYKWSAGQGMSYVPEETCYSITKAVINPSMEDARPTGTKWWFWNLTNLTTIEGLANLNTSEVTDMSYMFYFCSSLTSLDVSSFNTGKVSDMEGMFYYCSSLTTINCDADWSTGSASAGYMFYGCTSLVGGKGTKYDADKIDVTYARLDGLDGKPGYFSAKGVVRKTIYATLSGSTMTLYYDDQKASHSDVLDKWSSASGTYYVPEETCYSITKAVINPSMEDARPTGTKWWFWNLTNLTTIEGLANLNTSEVTDMSYMFYFCSSLTSLDVSSFNTGKVSDMEGMFSYCSSLTTINCDADWSTGSASAGYMFYGCTSLVGGKGTKYDADKIDKTYARPDGMGGKPGYFKELGPKEIYAALNGSTMTIYFDNKKASRPGVLDKWTPGMGVDMDDATCYSITKAVIDPSIAAALPTKTNFWFWNLANLTAIDGLANLNTSEVTNMSGMFMYCALLTEVDVSTFNTGKVTNMRSMFSSCPSLTELDLTGFNTGKVSDMETMFYGCSSLQTIYCNETWTPSSSDNMFYGCTSLEGGKGTKYDADKADKTYACPDGMGGKPGYFTVSAAPLTPEELKEIDAVIDLINAIGTVTYTPESKALIDAARAAYDALTDLQKEFVTNYSVLTDAEQAYAELEAVAIAKEQLKNIISEANELKAVALIYAPSAVSDIESLIADAQSMIDDPGVTVDQVNTKAATLTGDLHTIAVNLLDQAKEQLKQSIIALFLPGDYPSWYDAVITPALNQVDAVAWDFNKTVNENIVFFQTTGTQIYNDTKSALEALRAGDKRSIISSCAFTGFENGIKVDMTWNMAALNELVNTLNESVATEPYRLDAEMSSLGKWDPVNKELVILDPAEAQKLTAGDYQFITAVKIDGEEAKQYRLPKATEEVLSVTVDAAVWSVDLSGIVIDATYSYTYVTSPMFTISKSEDVELINEDQLKTQKIYHNGHFYILRGDHIFDIRGTMVK